MNLLGSIIAVLLLALLGLGISTSQGALRILTAAVPFVAFTVFLAGFAFRILKWGSAPVPFRIPTTCGQAESLPWIRSRPLESPAGFWSAAGRMALEVLLFRSLFRNTDARMIDGRPVYGSAKWLWFFALLFHGSLLVIVLRHLRFFIEPVAPWIGSLSALDGFFEIGVPTLYLSDAAVAAALAFLLLRRVALPRLRYISLFTDYFPLLLIAGAAASGLAMRHIFPADLNAAKTLALGWASLSPVAWQEASAAFTVHLCFVFTLMAWFPFSKLMHAGGVFLSPTRNLAGDSRRRRHVNPWTAPVKVHSYEEYEDEFRDKMKSAGLPVEKE